MNPSENLSLFTPPVYSSGNGKWSGTFAEALSSSGRNLSWDLPSLLSMVSFHHPCGDATLLREIKKNPWMSDVTDGEVHLNTIPRHGYRYESGEIMAGRLFELLTDEMIAACKSFKKGYILLSGGLDSRIIACALHNGITKGAIDTEITALTWGLPDSRDVRIADMVARELGFKWENIQLYPSIVLKNIDLAVRDLGCLTNAYHLHGMSWLVENIDRDSIVIAGSYGDGIGRAEYSGNHVLELGLMSPFNRFGIIRDEYYSSLKRQVVEYLDVMRKRYTWKNLHEMAEVERQGHYMRNLIGHSMSVINKKARLYQAFTSKEVYTYMWDIHPSLRNNSVYRVILGSYSPGIAELPWARTNKSLSGNTRKLDPSLTKRFNQYREWIATTLYDGLYESLDFGLFEELQVLDPENIKKLALSIRQGTNNYHAYNVFLWLTGLSKFRTMLGELQISVVTPDIQPDKASEISRSQKSKKSLKAMFFNNMYLFTGQKRLYRKIRKQAKIWLFILKRFPEKNNEIPVKFN